MPAPPLRTFTPARIVALALIGLLVLGLGFLRVAPDGGEFPVPSGAHAGDLILEPCEYATEEGPYPADCGTLVVPENRVNPQSRLIALPMIRIRAHSEHPRVPFFWFAGGPGHTALDFPQASRFADDRDVVLVGYRGVEGSSILDCPEVNSALKHSADLVAEESFRAFADGYRACADRLTADGVDLSGYNLTQRVDDVEDVRKALGYGRIDMLGQSVGSRLGMVYAWRYPNSINRSVLLAVNPPGGFLWDPKTTDEQLRHYADLCAQDDTCHGRTGDLAASMKETVADMPQRWMSLRIKGGNARLASFFGLMESTPEVGMAKLIAAPQILDSWLSAAEGDPSGLWFLSTFGQLIFPEVWVWGEVAAVAGSDSAAADRYFSTPGRSDSILGNPGTEFLFAGGGLYARVDKSGGWPANSGDLEYSYTRPSEIETLLIGGSVDFATPPINATRDLLPYLPNGHQVILEEIGHSGSFWSSQPEAGTRLIKTFLDTGKVDDSGYTYRKMDFTAGKTLTSIAKLLLWTLVGFALLMALSILSMAFWVRKRGRFGPKTSAFLRSFYPIVLGLGGWFAGLIVVMATLPAVALDDELLTALSVGLPIGLGVYFAWLDPARSSTVRIVGFAAAAGGSLVGAWLGFNASAGLVALPTTIIGAVIGANLVLIFLDIAWHRQAHRPLMDISAVSAPGSPDSSS